MWAVLVKCRWGLASSSQFSFSFLSAHSALSRIDLALDQGDPAALYEALSSAALGLRGLRPENNEWYFKQLMREKQQKQEVRGGFQGSRNCFPFQITDKT